MELMTSYERKGLEKGLEKGKQESICKFLQTRFGSSANQLQKQVRSIENSDVLDEVLEKVFAAETLAEVQRIINRKAYVKDNDRNTEPIISLSAEIGFLYYRQECTVFFKKVLYFGMGGMRDIIHLCDEAEIEYCRKD